jgi:hypothetical protein
LSVVRGEGPQAVKSKAKVKVLVLSCVLMFTTSHTVFSRRQSTVEYTPVLNQQSTACIREEVNGAPLVLFVGLFVVADAPEVIVTLEMKPARRIGNSRLT